MIKARNRTILRTIPLLISIFSSSFPTYAKYSGGTGEPNDPYQIATAEDLMLLGETPEDYDKHFILTTDIDLSAYIGVEFNIIGTTYESSFTGVFDGNSHAISNFSYASTDSNNIGLFGSVGTQGQIKDLGLIDPNIEAGTGDYVGSMVGELNGTITGCYVEGGIISGNENIGGLVGVHGKLRGYPEPDFTISNCYSTANVVGHNNVGGLVGSNYRGLINNCYALGSVSGKESVGGLTGQNGNWGGWPGGNPSTPGAILNCYSTGLVLGESNVGGLIGLHVEGAVIACFWDMETSGQTTSARGAGKTTLEMKMADTFVGWGECEGKGIWTIDQDNDYPRLRWENKPGMLIEGQLSDFLMGTGVEDNPYLIYTGRQFDIICRFPCEWDKHFKLMNNIELGGYAGASFNFIGHDQYYPFTGVFDGNGHTISNFTYDSNEVNYIGLFGYVNDPNAKIKDLGLIDPNVDAGTGAYVGSLVGGLIGGTITGCYAYGGAVKGRNTIGGLVGSNEEGLITTCCATVSVSGFSDVGGMVGHNGGSISTSYSIGTVSGDRHIGGLVGYNGIWAILVSSIDTVSSTGVYVFGLTRANIVGAYMLSDPPISNCYSTGEVKGINDVGGLVGSNWGTITNCFSTGSVIGETDIGGLVGRGSPSRVENSFWDIETSGKITSHGGMDKTTVEMQTINTFLDAGWDFVGEKDNGTEDIWWIDKGRDYPRLYWELISEN